MGRIIRWGHVTRSFGPSCVYQVYFLRKSTEFRYMHTECQIIIIRFIIIISNKPPVIAKRCHILYFLPILAFGLPSISLLSWSTDIVCDDLHKEGSGDMVLVVVNIEERGGMMT